MTKLILAIDALDEALIDRFDIDAYRLENSGPMETIAHMRDQPYTPEAWATAATGLHPNEHGIHGAGTSEWENPVLSVASQLTGHLPETIRGTLGRIVSNLNADTASIGQTEAETIFDGPEAVVRNWPGVTDGADLQRAWELMVAVGETIDKNEFERHLFVLCAEQFAWATEMLNHNVGVAGVHVHTLDAAGHAYSTDETALRRVYERVAEFVDVTRKALGPHDELLLLSDHGMTVSFHSDGADIKSPGSHSWRAFSATTTKSRPRHIDQMVDWVGETSTDSHVLGELDDLSISKDQLRDLGYLN
jgi:hypothetical protein